MEPIPETREAFDLLDPGLADDDALASFVRWADRVLVVVPECVGLSVATHRYGVTMTVLASTPQVALLDALQYVDGGPCVRAVESGAEVLEQGTSALDEEQWAMLARGSAAAGVHSTLSLLLTSDESATVTGSVNLYGSSAHCFDGRRDQVARVLGALPHSAVANADLSFESRIRAQEAPDQLRDDSVIEAAAGHLAAHRRTDVDEARRHLLRAASCADVAPVVLARAVISTLAAPPS